MTLRVTFTLDEHLAELAAKLDLDVSAAAHDGVETAIRAELAQRDRAIYLTLQDRRASTEWANAEGWGTD